MRLYLAKKSDDIFCNLHTSLCKQGKLHTIWDDILPILTVNKENMIKATKLASRNTLILVISTPRLHMQCMISNVEFMNGEWHLALSEVEMLT